MPSVLALTSGATAISELRAIEDSSVSCSTVQQPEISGRKGAASGKAAVVGFSLYRPLTSMMLKLCV